MTAHRPFAAAVARLRGVGLRPTRQRLALARLLFEGGHRHVTAEQLHGEAVRARTPVSLATVYNTLHRFSRCGMLREVVVESGRSYFDTNVSHHHHFYVEDEGRLIDIPGDSVALAALPEAPEGMAVARLDVFVRLRPDPGRTAAGD